MFRNATIGEDGRVKMTVVCVSRAICWYVAMNVLFHRQSQTGMQETEGGFRTQLFTDNTDINFSALRADLDSEVDRFTNVGSGWLVTAIHRFVIPVGQYRPL
jgi:hypothetical protein